MSSVLLPSYMTDGRFKVVSWNVNGIRSAFAKGFLPSLHLLDADVVLLQETRAETSQIAAELLAPGLWQDYWISAKKKNDTVGLDSIAKRFLIT